MASASVPFYTSSDERIRPKAKICKLIYYETAEAAENVIKTVNGTLLNNLNMKPSVGHCIRRQERQSELNDMEAQFTNLQIKNLHPDMDWVVRMLRR
jgi:hypothetical protein